MEESFGWLLLALFNLIRDALFGPEPEQAFVHQARKNNAAQTRIARPNLAEISARRLNRHPARRS
jgi:hypothetical protein